MSARFRSRLARIAVAWLVLATIQIVSGAVAIATAPTVTYRDEFTNVSYTGNNGTGTWAGGWVEDDVGGTDPSNGSIEAKSDGHCFDDKCLYMGQAGYNASVWRAVDLTGASSAQLTFKYERHKHGSGSGAIHLSVFNGIGWTALATYPLSIDDNSSQNASFDLTPYIAAGTIIKFEQTGNTDDSHMNVDDVEILATMGTPPVFDQDLGDRTDAEGAVIAISATATDPGGGTVVYSATGLPPGVSIDSGSGQITGTIGYTAAAGSPYSTKITATVGAQTADDTFTWTVTDTNRPPVAADDTASPTEDGPGVVIAILTNDSDPDLDPIVLQSLDTASLTGGSVVDNGNGTVTYTPNPNFDGAEEFGYTINDGKGGTASAVVDIVMNALPDQPQMAALGTLTGPEESLITCTAIATDPDTGDEITYTLVDGGGWVPPGAAIDPTSGVFTWIPSEEKGPGSYTFAVRATDLTGLFVEQPLTVVVEESNSPPILNPIGPKSSSEGETVLFLVGVTDPDNPPTTFTYSATGLPPGLSIDTVTGKISGVVGANAGGGSPYSVTISVSDGGSPPLTDAVSFQWTVVKVNRPPVISGAGGTATVSVDVPVSFGTVSATDPDGDPLTYSAAGLPPGLGIDSKSGVVSGTVPAGFGGTSYSVTVTVSDPSGSSASTTMLVSVEPEVAPPAGGAAAAPPPPVEPPAKPASPPAITPPTEPAPRVDPEPTPEPEPAPVTTAVTTPSLVAPQPSADLVGKTNLVVTSSESESVGQGSDRNRTGLDALDRMLVAFGMVVEDLEDQLGSALALGVGISFFAVVGVDRRREEEQPEYKPAFLNTL